MIGFEARISFPSNPHLHWFIAVIDLAITPNENGYYQYWLNMPGIEEPERVPIACHANGKSLLKQGQTYTAIDCL